jgi:hypothetical protein
MHYDPGVGGPGDVERIKGIRQEHILTAQALTPLVQEMHITIGHTICELLEARLC